VTYVVDIPESRTLYEVPKSSNSLYPTQNLVFSEKNGNLDVLVTLKVGD